MYYYSTHTNITGCNLSISENKATADQIKL